MGLVKEEELKMNWGEIDRILTLLPKVARERELLHC